MKVYVNINFKNFTVMLQIVRYICEIEFLGERLPLQN